MLETFDLLVRGAAIGSSLIVFALLVGRRETRRKSLPVGLLVVALTGHMILPSVCGPNPDWKGCGFWLVPASILPISITWFVLAVFLEGQSHKRLGQALMAGSVVTSVAWMLNGYSAFCVTGAVILYTGILVLSLLSARGDLVECRRVFRPVFVAAVAVFGVVRTLFDGYLQGGPRPPEVDLTFSLIVLGFTLVFAIWSLNPGRDIWTETEAQPAQPNRPAPADQLALDRIEAAMADEIWRREGLTIGDLAQEIDVAEHRLRKAINQDLGYRNFSTFVNGYRIDAAKTALAAPENAHRTILEIAYESGFASLAPFNRAFRAATGKSPRDFRREPDIANRSFSV